MPNQNRETFFPPTGRYLSAYLFGSLALIVFVIASRRAKKEQDDDEEDDYSGKVIAGITLSLIALLSSFLCCYCIFTNPHDYDEPTRTGPPHRKQHDAVPLSSQGNQQLGNHEDEENHPERDETMT